MNSRSCWWSAAWKPCGVNWIIEIRENFLHRRNKSSKEKIKNVKRFSGYVQSHDDEESDGLAIATKKFLSSESLALKRVVFVSRRLIRSRFLCVYQNSLVSLQQNIYRREAREMGVFPSIKITKQRKLWRNFLGKENIKRENKHKWIKDKKVN